MTSTPEITEPRPLVSVVIPTRNRLDLLKRTVASVMRQTLHRCEVVVVDDASSDGTATWLAEQEGDRLKAIVLQERAERSAARNRGFAEARGGFVLFLDDDDLLHPSALQSLHSALTRHPEAIGAAGRVEFFDERGRRSKVPWPRRSLTRSVWTELLVGWSVYVQAVLWRAETIRAAGGWNEGIPLSEDTELLRRVSRLGPMTFIPAVVVRYRIHGGQWISKTQSEAHQIREVALQEYVDSLPPGERATAERLVVGHQLWLAGLEAYSTLDARGGFWLYLRAVRAAPVFLTSPLLRIQSARAVAKAVVGVLSGKRGLSALRRAKKSLTHSTDRIEASMKIADDVPYVP